MMETERSEVAMGHPGSFDKILSRLREMFGEDRAAEVSGGDFRVDGELSRVVAFPHNIEELSEMMKLAHDERWRVITAGAGAWLEMGNRPVQFHLIVSTARMNRVLEYEPGDLTATLEAGVALAAFNGQAASHRQFIPLDPFGDERSTLGGIVASASSGPLRCAYGTPRDWLIGLSVVHADGGITKAGGKVVKNVAGYDLCKLYAGSFGTLAVIAEMSFKLRTLPPDEKTLVFYAEEPAALCSLALRVTDSDLQPSALELISPSKSAKLPIESNLFSLVLRFLNETETIDSQVAEATAIGGGSLSALMAVSDSRAFWSAYHESENSTGESYELTLSGLPSDLASLFEDINRSLPPADLRAHAANGVIRLRADEDWLDHLKPKRRAEALASMRRAAQERGGHMVILRAPEEIKDRLDVWGEAGQTEHLMRALKEKFDPMSQLNPGRFVAGI